MSSSSVQPNLNTRSTPVLNGVMKPDLPIALLHVLNTIILLTEASNDVANLRECKLFFAVY